MTEQHPRVHLCLVEPAGYVHSGALIDPLLFFQHQFGRCGAVVSSAKNHLVEGAVNLVFGAHLGVRAVQLQGFRCVIVNLEQLGPGGADLSSEYLTLLRDFPTVDYHPENGAAYSAGGHTTSVVRIGHADYLDQTPLPFSERDIDLLFLGTMTARRWELLQEVEATGQRVTVPRAPVYGPDRDALVRRSKAVLNVGAYETTRFEQVRASVVLSCGTPLVSERRAWTSPTDERFTPFVHWFDVERPGDFFGGSFATDRFFEDSRSMLESWRKDDVLLDYADLLSRWERHGAVSGRPLVGTR